ncbi:hypothetical protein L6R49_25870 [Myxococcota bacterium]|nr:hypothetical protein [Myxococcota bacterium]
MLQVYPQLREVSQLGEALLREHEAQHHSWSAPSSRYARLLTPHSAEHLARAAQLYGLRSFEESELVPPLRTALVALDPWPERGSDNPFVWDDGLAFVGLTASFIANGDLLVPLLTQWEDDTEPLPLIESVVDTLLSRAGGEREQALITAKRLLSTRQTPGSQAWRDLGRPWLEPLLELGVVRVDEALKYALTTRGAALAARWRETPMPVEQRLSEALAEDWVVALGQTPREPTDDELLAMLAGCPNFGGPGERVARLEELALWAQATWIRTNPGVCASAATLRRLIGQVGFAERAGVLLGSGLMSYESFVRWTNPDEILSPRHIADEAGQPSLLAADDSLRALHTRSFGEVEELVGAPTLPPSERPLEHNDHAYPRLAESKPELDVAHVADNPPVLAALHVRAWRRYARTLLETPGAFALGGPNLWLRQLDELLADPAAQHLLSTWRKEEHWTRSADVWCVQATLLAGLVELKNVPSVRKLPEALPFLSLLHRWQDTQADIVHVRVLGVESRRCLGALQRALLTVIRDWLRGEGGRSALEEWPEIRRVTRWLLADAALLGGHSRETLIAALSSSSTDLEPLAALLAPQRGRTWEAVETFPLLGEGLNEDLLRRVQDAVKGSFTDRMNFQLEAVNDADSTVGGGQRAWRATARIEAPSEERAREEAVLLFESARARARHVLAREGIWNPRVTQSDQPAHKLQIVPEGGDALHEPPLRTATAHRAYADHEPPDPQPLGILPARPCVEIPANYVDFDDALLSLSRANEGDGGDTATQITLIWVALERLQPSQDRDRAAKVQQRASRLLARAQLAAECGDVLRRAYAALHEATLANTSPSPEALRVWRSLRGPEEEGRYAALGHALASSREQLFGAPLLVNDEEAMRSLAQLRAESSNEGDASAPLNVLIRIAEDFDPALALDLRALSKDLSTPKELARRLRAERLLIAGAIHRAYRVRNRLVHASDTGLGEDRVLFAELRDHLIPKVDSLVIALMHPRCAGLSLAERWALAQERLDRSELFAEEKDGKSVGVPDLLARSAWGTPD